jgi:hypothetical protein
VKRAHQIATTIYLSAAASFAAFGVAVTLAGLVLLVTGSPQ